MTVQEYFDKGKIAYENDDYKEAIKHLSKVIELEPKLIDGYYNRGLAKSKLPEYIEAIEDYTKAIDIDPNYVIAYNNRGLVKAKLADYNGAIEDYSKAIEIHSTYTKAFNNRGIVYTKRKQYKEAAIDFMKAKTSILKVIALGEEGKKVAKIMLNERYDDFFNRTTINYVEKEDYAAIYIQSLEIIARLKVKDEEMPISHYTKIHVSEEMLFKSSPFRISSIHTNNDLKEGNTLFHYLFADKEMSTQIEEYGAFTGCFLFNNDSLNPFRLYGKTDDKEGTGISISFNEKFFNKDVIAPLNTHIASISTAINKKKKKKLPDITHSSDSESKEPERKPLFRCIYIDLETKEKDVVSLGQKEKSVFKREGKTDNDYNKYKQTIDEMQEEIIKALKELREQAQKLDAAIVYKLLLNLRYLVKHAAFKEEQECRIIEIKKFTDKDIKENENGCFYMDYLKLTPENVEKICFGPKAEDIDQFKQHLFQKGYSEKDNTFLCRSKAPFA